MKNKFKKSKIIVPALALITATTVASVTGTVAWFTASRTITITGTSFHTTTLNSNLKVKVESLHCGTTTTSNSSDFAESGSVTVDGLLTHGSYNAQALSNNATAQDSSTTNPTTYGANMFVPLMDSYAVTGYSSLGRVESNAKDDTGTTAQTNAWKAGTSSDNKNIWYGVAWKMTFKVDSDVSGVTNTLHFDPYMTTFTDSVSGGTTIKGLRIALMANDRFYVASGDEQTKHVVSAGDRFTYTELTTDSNPTKDSATYEDGKYFATNSSSPSMTSGEFSAAKSGKIFTRSGEESFYTYTEVTDKTSLTFTSGKYFATNTSTTAMTLGEFNAAKSGKIYTRSIPVTVETDFANDNFKNVTSASASYPNDGADNNTLKTANYGYLGDIDTTNGLTVIAVAWFEGCNTNIVTATSTVMSDVTANLSFYTRTAASSN